MKQEQCSLPNPRSRQAAEIKKTEIKPSALGGRVYNVCSLTGRTILSIPLTGA